MQEKGASSHRAVGEVKVEGCARGSRELGYTACQQGGKLRALQCADGKRTLITVEWRRPNEGSDPLAVERLTAAMHFRGPWIGEAEAILEACADEGGHLTPREASTDLFIEPGYRFRAVDGLLTNFHLPKSTLLMLVSALAGRERVLELYAGAIERGYRFYSYGDAMLLLP